MIGSLTRREIEVLTAAAHGRSQRETATELSISRGVVRSYLGTCLAKLGAASTPHAVALAIRERLIDPAQVPDGITT
ncbi:LuxR C-terminal-related transcriptional regulator [Streptacidiphilus sp. MAP5-3]|uniref:LuxR C-terminal-related transcriptional regulator n=1 Tax=unclassified Streptacidiphilus TaxID=2643834 RepID=UPI003514D910